MNSTTKNQVGYTQEEKDLAARFEVEPKLVRSFKEIAEKQLQRFKQFLNKSIDERVVTLKQTAAEPEETETKEQSEQEEESQSSTGIPFLDESEFQEQRFQNCQAEIQKIVSHYPVEWRPKVLTAALERATRGKGATEKLSAMEEQVRKVCDKLSIRTKAVLAVLGELSSVSGVSNDVGSYGTDILHSAFGQKDVKQALEQFPDDNDVAFLSYVFGLAHSVVNADDKIFLQEIAAEEETTTEEPQPEEDTETQDHPEQEQPAELSIDEQTQPEPEDAEAGPDTGIKALDDFLERLSYEATAAAYGALRLVCVSDATGKKMREYLQKQVALLDNPQQVDGLMMDGQVLADIKWFLGFVRGAEIGYVEC